MSDIEARERHTRHEDMFIDLTRRIGDMEVEMHGHPRNGGGFIEETRDTLELVRTGIATLDSRVRDLDAKVDKLATGRGGVVSVLTATIPPLLVGIGSVVTILLTR